MPDTVFESGDTNMYALISKGSVGKERTVKIRRCHRNVYVVERGCEEVPMAIAHPSDVRAKVEQRS